MTMINIRYYKFCMAMNKSRYFPVPIYIPTPRGTLCRMWNGSWKSTRLIRWTSFTSNEKSTQAFWYPSQTALILEAGNCPRERWGWNPASSLIADRSEHSGKRLSTIFWSSITFGWCGRVAEDFGSSGVRWSPEVSVHGSSSGWSHKVHFFLRRK